MIYDHPVSTSKVDQGDIIDDCPLLSSLCASECRRARLTDLYRAHLGRHVADTYARIGLPEPYETE